MKKNIFLKWLFIGSSLLLQADNENIAQNAQTHFSQKKWTLALKNYNKLEHKNVTVLKNMGICFFNLKKYPQALIKFKQAFQKARIKDFYSLINLEKETYEKLEKKAPSLAFYLLQIFFLKLPIFLVQLIFLFLLLMLLHFFIRHWRVSDFTKKERSFLKKIIRLLSVCAVIWYLKLLYFDKYQAIVIKPQILVYAGPEKTFHVIEKLCSADEVVISEEKNGMYHVQHLKISGWIDSDTVELINNYE